tara:strand:- start:2485 stop:2790 length:306 start_codon:yes stop_codon:yes gene_type:complete
MALAPIRPTVATSEGNWEIVSGTADPATIISDAAVAKNCRGTNNSGSSGKRVTVQKKKGSDEWEDVATLDDGVSVDVGVGDSLQVVRTGSNGDRSGTYEPL